MPYLWLTHVAMVASAGCHHTRYGHIKLTTALMDRKGSSDDPKPAAKDSPSSEGKRNDGDHDCIQLTAASTIVPASQDSWANSSPEPLHERILAAHRAQFAANAAPKQPVVPVPRQLPLQRYGRVESNPTSRVSRGTTTGSNKRHGIPELKPRRAVRMLCCVPVCV